MLYAAGKLRGSHKMNRKGQDLKENVPGIIIAVIGLAIIVAAVWLSISAYRNQDTESAKAIINNIDGKISLIEEGQPAKVVIKGVKDWNLIGWSKNDLNRPDKCYFKSCICICKLDLGRINLKPTDYANDCQANGMCRLYDSGNASAFTINSYQKEKKPLINSSEDLLNVMKNPSIAGTDDIDKLNYIEFDNSKLFELTIYKDSKTNDIALVNLVDGYRPAHVEM
jgi:hypothetical protein